MGKPDYGTIECNVCKKPGGVSLRKVRRFSGPVVFIGFLFLVPSLMGMFGGGCLVCATGKVASEQTAEQQAEYKAALARIDGVSERHVSKIVEMGVATRDDLRSLGLKQQAVSAVMAASLTTNAGAAGTAIGAGCAGGAGFLVLFVSLIGVLLGGILTMKKKVLACELCGGVHSDAV